MWNNGAGSRDETHLTVVGEMTLADSQMAEQLYNSAGLNPVVQAGLKDYDKRLQQEDKMITKVFGPRGSDIQGYGEAVAKRVALAVYGLLNRQYGGQMGDLRSYIMQLEDERNRANTRYDELMGRVVGILGEEYKDLRTDSHDFMEKLTTVLGDDARAARLDHAALAEKLADIDGLRSRIGTLTQEKEQLDQRIAEMESRIGGLESEKAAQAAQIARLNGVCNGVAATLTALPTDVPHKEIGDTLGGEVYAYLLKDSRVPRTVIDGVGKFIDFRKYLRMAAAQGAEEATRRSEQKVREALDR